MRKKTNRALFLDIEATCSEDGVMPQGETQEPIQIGWTVVETFTGKITVNESVLVIPETSSINEFCTRLTGITRAAVAANGIPLKDAIRRMPKNIDAFAWGNFDFKTLRKCHPEDLGFSNEHNFKNIYAHARGLKQELGLARALEFENMEFIGTPHDAKWDAYNTALLWLKLTFNTVITS